jgi:hypothetical protein
MIQTNIDTVDHRTEKEVAVPADVIAVVERANQILQDQFRTAPDRGLQASWCQFEEVTGVGWCVNLDVFTPVYGYGRQLRVNDLRQPSRAKELIWEVLDEFAQTYSDKVDEQLRKIRTDLKELLAAGAN